METASSVGDFELLSRFLIYGREDGVYFAEYNRNIGDINRYTRSLDRLISDGKGKEVVKLIRTISNEGRAPRQTTLLYALSQCARSNDIQTKKAAYHAIIDICRIPTHLFLFVKFVTKKGSNGVRGGWGRATRKALSEWYNQERFKSNPKSLVRKCTKYRKRHSYTHRDILRLAHVKPKSSHTSLVLQYLIEGKYADFYTSSTNVSDGIVNETKIFILAVEEAKRCTREHIARLAQLIRQHQLAVEHIPNNLLDSPAIWQALVYQMPMCAMIRNLGRMSSVGILRPDSLEENHVVERLQEQDRLRKARIHPLNILTAWNVYKCGKAFSSETPIRWDVNGKISLALERAFYLSFPTPNPSGKKILLAIDNGTNMLNHVIGMPIVTARGAAVALALYMSKIETENSLKVISVVSNATEEISISPNDNLESLSRRFAIVASSSSTSDSAQPVRWCIQKREKYDAIVYLSTTTSFRTDSPSACMRYYRQFSNIHNARYVAVSLSSKDGQPIDSNDQYMLSVVGFDTAALNVILDFIRRP